MSDESMNGKRTIMVQGHGEVYADPDLVVLRLSLNGRDRQYAKAVENLNRRVDTLRRDLETAGIEREQLKTTHFRIHEEKKWVESTEEESDIPTGNRPRRSTRGRRTEQSEGKWVFVGYRADHDLKLELPLDQDLLNRAFAQVSASTSEPRMSISFDISDREVLNQRALKAAVENAHKSAQTMTDAAGAQLGEIVRIEYGAVEVHMRSYSVMYDAVAEPASPAPDITPSALHAEDRVTVVWEII